MSRPRALADRLDPVTADCTYIRWLGDRSGMEQITKTWNRTVVDRSAELAEWAGLLTELRRRGVSIYCYVNNHFAGHSPATIRSLLDLLAPELRKRRPTRGRPAHGPSTSPHAQPASIERVRI
jgi:uncharacterized protein YecE (DUF72 family)